MNELPNPKSSIHLVLNCSEANLQVVLGNMEQVLWSQVIHVPGRAMKYIAPVIKSGLDFLKLDPSQLSCISCVEGPGSFTGIRMIFAHAMGMACSAQIPMGKISYFEALIHGPGKLLHSPVWIFLHSRRDQVYAMGYHSPSLIHLGSPANMHLSQVKDILNHYQKEKVHVLGSGVRKNPQVFDSDHINILPEIWDNPSSEALLSLSFKSFQTLDMQLPEYLRPSDAEENLQK